LRRRLVAADIRNFTAGAARFGYFVDPLPAVLPDSDPAGLSRNDATPL